MTTAATVTPRVSIGTTGSAMNSTVVNSNNISRHIHKNLAIANRSRVSCINTNNNTMTLKSGFEVTQGHCSLGTVSYSPSIVTMALSVAVCDIFSVKQWPDLENRVRVHSRSLEMAPFDRSPTSLNT